MSQPTESKDKTIHLVDGSPITAAEAAKLGKKYQPAFRNLAFLAFFVAFLALVLFVIEYSAHDTGWVAFLILELALVGTGILFWMIFREVDLEHYGISILNFRKHMQSVDPEQALICNEINADVILELDIAKGNLFFLDTEHHRWQYRYENKLSPIFAAQDLIGFEAQKDGFAFCEKSLEPVSPDAPRPRITIRVRFSGESKNIWNLDCKSEEVAIECVKELEQFHQA